MERVFYHKEGSVWTPPFVPGSQGVRETLAWFTREFRRYTFPAAKLPWCDFPLRYVGRKRRVYEIALESLRIKGLMPSDAKIRSFIKTEKLPYGRKPVVPRVISPRSARFNLVLGCYLSHLEHTVYNIVGRILGGVAITKGLNAVQTAQLIHSKWLKFRSPVAYGLDASRFDQHVSMPLLQWEHSIYQMFYSGEDKASLKALLDQQLRNRCVCSTDDGRVEYTTVGTRCSGDMNTALGNCLIMCAIVASYMHDKRPNVPYELINNGDDCVVIMESDQNIDDIGGYFKALGLVLKVEPPAYIMEHIDYCQARPVFDGVLWRMVRDPRATLSKDSITVKPIDDPRVYPRYLKAVGDCGMALTGGLPILQSYYHAMCRSAGSVAPLEDPSLETGFHMMSKGLTPRWAAVSHAARVSFGTAFSVSLATQLRLEAYYDQLDLSYRVGARSIPQPKW